MAGRSPRRQGALAAARRAARGVALPLALSLALHAAAAGGLVWLTGAMAPDRARPAPRADLTLTLDPPPAPSPAPLAGPAPGAAPPIPSPALPPAAALPGAPERPAPPGAPPAPRPSGDGGVMADLSRQSGPALSALFAGLGAERAGSVVYVVDGSGAMVTTLRWVIEDLRRSVERLSPAQTFAIIIFRNRPPQGDEPAALCDAFDPVPGSPARLLPATGANKRAAAAWLGTISPRGLSNPTEGLRRALALRPDIVFLLARSIPRSGESPQWENGREAILAELERLNPLDPATGRRPARIKTIQFIEEDPTGTMQAIGRAHGGEDGYTLVTLEEVERR